jgi:hypothetical protein
MKHQEIAECMALLSNQLVNVKPEAKDSDVKKAVRQKKSQDKKNKEKQQPYRVKDCKFGDKCRDIKACAFKHAQHSSNVVKEATVHGIKKFFPARAAEAVGFVKINGERVCHVTAVANKLATTKHQFEDVDWENDEVQFVFSGNVVQTVKFNDVTEMPGADIVVVKKRINTPALRIAKGANAQVVMRVGRCLSSTELNSNQGSIVDIDAGSYTASSESGDCGCPIIDNDGKVIGIHCAGDYNNVNYFVPLINDAKNFQ